MAKKKKAVKKKIVRKEKHVQKVIAAKKEPVKHPMSLFFFFIMTFIVIALVFAQLFLQDKSFNINLGKYNIEFLFPPNSIPYILVFFVVIVILVLIRHAHKSRKLKKEKKAEPKKPIKKVEQKKVSSKTVKKQQNPGTLYFGLFLFSLVLFLGAIILNNLPAMILALALMTLSLFGYQQLKKAGVLTREPGKKGKQEKQAKPKGAGFNLFKKQKESIAKEAKKLPKIELGKYETYFDTLYRIIEKKGKVKLSVLATYFGVTKKKVEKWATILEDHEMLSIYYPLIGDPELRKIEPKEPEKNQTEAKP